MINNSISHYREIVFVDFEFETSPGERPVPVCLVAKELRSGRTFPVFQDEFGAEPPYAHGTDVLFVAYFASAEIGCYLALGWHPPPRVLDLYCEFRNLTNGLRTIAGNGLVGALAHFGIDHLAAGEKRELQISIGTGAWRGTVSPATILNYCAEDVTATEQLFLAMIDGIDLPRALLRGRYMAAVARMEFSGVPVDAEMLARLREYWFDIQDRLIADIDADYGVYDGRTFKTDRFADDYLVRHNISWPFLESGALDLQDDTFREMARAHPRIAPLRELRSAMSDLRLNDLAVGRDGRNRAMLSPFRARSGRNQPSNSRFIFGPSVWMRSLIKPPEGYGIALLDFSQQEFCIAGALSGDDRMIEAYQSGDAYLAFAKQSGMVPEDATKKTHKAQRDLCKACVLGVQYSMAEVSLAARIGKPVIVARDLLRLHHETYSRFWKWSDAAVDVAMTTTQLQTVFGWTVHIDENPNPRFLRNFPMQANGAEMLRLAICLAVERGIEVIAPVHDAVMILAPLDRIDHDTEKMRAIMTEASRIVLDGFETRSDVQIVRFPDRYVDEDRGRTMWERTTALINNLAH